MDALDYIEKCIEECESSRTCFFDDGNLQMIEKMLDTTEAELTAKAIGHIKEANMNLGFALDELQQSQKEDSNG